MRDELLAARPTENRGTPFTTYSAPTTLVTRASGTHTAPVAKMPAAQVPEAQVPEAQVVVRGLSARYRRTRRRLHQLSVRTKLLIVLGAYMLLTAAVVFGSPLDIIDRAAAMSDLAHRFPHAAPWVLNYVMLGQRGPSSHVAFVYLLWRAARQRSWRPLILFVTALTMLNVTVGSVKLATGRLGPALTTHPRAVFDGGDIFPSGHTSNAVVIFGVLAMVAVEHRRAWIALAVFVSATVGLSTIFLDTHWVTDVLGGWLAGALVVLALPATYALIERWGLRVIHAVTEWFRPAHARWNAATWEALPRRDDLASEMLTEDAMYR